MLLICQRFVVAVLSDSFLIISLCFVFVKKFFQLFDFQNVISNGVFCRRISDSLLIIAPPPAEVNTFCADLPK